MYEYTFLSLLPSVLEVHQFAQEAVVAEAWLTAQEPLISSNELGASVDEVEQLIRRHEAFRKAAATWEERFSSLRRLTTVITSSSLCEYMQRQLKVEDFQYRETYIKREIYIKHSCQSNVLNKSQSLILKLVLFFPSAGRKVESRAK